MSGVLGLTAKAFPALAGTTPESLDNNRFTRFHPTELIEMGVAAPAVGTPGGTPEYTPTPTTSSSANYWST